MMNFKRYFYFAVAGVVIAGGISSVQAELFQKDGNNGSASCRTFCAGEKWGRVGEAKSAQLLNFPCNQVMGKMNGQEDTCTCQRLRFVAGGFAGIQLVPDGAGPFVKHGNDGSVSCDAFCLNNQWGGNENVGICTASNAVDVPVDLSPGVINNGSPLTCQCEG